MLSVYSCCYFEICVSVMQKMCKCYCMQEVTSLLYCVGKLAVGAFLDQRLA